MPPEPATAAARLGVSAPVPRPRQRAAEIEALTARYRPPVIRVESVSSSASCARLASRPSSSASRATAPRRCRRAVARTGLGARFHLLGLRDDVPELLRALDAFALTSRWEGMPRVVVEAAAAGVPIVATDVGGTRDIVLDGGSGFLCRPGDVDQLARAAIALLVDRGLADRLAAAARARVTGDFALSRVVDEHVALYRELGLRA